MIAQPQALATRLDTWLAEAGSDPEVADQLQQINAAADMARRLKVDIDKQNILAYSAVKRRRVLARSYRNIPGNISGRPKKKSDTAVSDFSPKQQWLSYTALERKTVEQWALFDERVPEEESDRIFGERIADKEMPWNFWRKMAGMPREDEQPHVAYNSGVNEWYTPVEYIEAARTVMGRIDLDPASSAEANEVVKATRYYTAADNGSAQAWAGCVWMNPPYASDLIRSFCQRFSDSVIDGEIEQGIVLVNNATETDWFGLLINTASAIVFPRGRVRFWQPSGELGAPLQGQAIIYAGPYAKEFLQQFRPFGWGAML